MYVILNYIIRYIYIVYYIIRYIYLILGKTGLELQHFKGKLVIKAIGSGGSSQKLTIPWIAQVLQGGLEVNASITHYCSLQSNQTRNFSVVNKFKLPLAITNVTMSSHVKTFFTVSGFFKV